MLLVLIFCTPISYANSDDHYQDKTAEDLILLAEQLRFTDVDRANSKLLDAYNLSKKDKNHASTIEVILLQAKIAITQKDYYLAQQYLLRGERVLAHYDDDMAKVYVLSAMADVKRYLKEFDASQKYIDEAVFLARKSKKDELMFISLEIKGALEKSRKHYKEALETFIEVEQYAQEMPGQDVMRLYRNLAAMYSKQDSQALSARYYAKCVKLLEKMGNLRDIPENILDLAVTQRKMSLYDKALESANQALTMSRENEDEINELRALVVISVIYRRLSSYEEALTYAVQAYTMYEENKNYNGLASAANSIGSIYKNLDQNENSANYFERVLSLPEDSIQVKFRASALRELGSIVFYEGKHDEGIRRSQQSYNLFAQISDNNGVATVHKNLGKMYQSLNNIEKSLRSYYSAKEIFNSTGDNWNEAIIDSLLASLLAKTEPVKAIAYAEGSIEVAKAIKAKSILKTAYAALISAYEVQKNYKSALRYARSKERLVAQMKDDSMNKRIAEIYIVLDIKQKEKELQNFKRQQAITSLELNRKQAALDLLNKEQEISSLENKNTLFSIAIVLTLLMMAYIAFRKKK